MLVITSNIGKLIIQLEWPYLICLDNRLLKNIGHFSAGNQTKEEEPVVLCKHAACEKCTTNGAVQRVSNVGLDFFKA